MFASTISIGRERNQLYYENSTKNASGHFFGEIAYVTDEWKAYYMVIEIPKDWIEKEIDSEGQIVFHIIDFCLEQSPPSKNRY